MTSKGMDRHALAEERWSRAEALARDLALVGIVRDPVELMETEEQQAARLAHHATRGDRRDDRIVDGIAARLGATTRARYRAYRRRCAGSPPMHALERAMQDLQRERDARSLS